MTWAKNVMASYSVGDPLEHSRIELLEVPGKVEEFTENIFHLCQFLEKNSKTLKNPPQMTWMDKIKKDDDLYPLRIFYAVLFPESVGQYSYSDRTANH